MKAAVRKQHAELSTQQRPGQTPPTLRKSSSRTAVSPPRSPLSQRSPRSRKRRREPENTRSDGPSLDFHASVVPHNYNPRGNEVVKSFDEVLDGQSLVHEGRNFFQDSSRVKISGSGGWEALTRFREVVLRGETFAVGADVLINNGQFDQDCENNLLSPTLHGAWAARILEIRAIDAENVWLLVNWYQRPDDIQPHGRQEHHGMTELLASNDVDITEATTLIENVDVHRWENPDEHIQPHKLFCRQFVGMDVPGNPQFSKLAGGLRMRPAIET